MIGILVTVVKLPGLLGFATFFSLMNALSKIVISSLLPKTAAKDDVEKLKIIKQQQDDALKLYIMPCIAPFLMSWVIAYNVIFVDGLATANLKQ